MSQEQGQPEPQAIQASGAAVLIRVSDVVERPIEWLWPNRIPLGKITLFQGDPSVGKSTVTLDIAARITKGATWPDGHGTAPQGCVILVSAEDGIADTIRPRLTAAGAGLDCVHVLEGFATKEKGGVDPVSLDTHVNQLHALLLERPDVRLVIIDPISAYLGGVDSHVNADVRKILGPLSKLAEARAVSFIIVTHMNKSAGTKAMYRGTGSLAFVAAARAAWAFSKDSGDPTRRLMTLVKNNLAREATGLAYTIVGDPPHVQWDPTPITTTADEALGSESGSSDDRYEKEDAADFLRELLAAGPKPAKEVFAAAKQAGHSEATIKRAKRSAGVQTVQVGFHGGWMWSLKQSTGDQSLTEAHPESPESV